ncbi:MAG: hypothetical protein AAGB15_13085 [Pseudomonadota bacterium]
MPEQPSDISVLIAQPTTGSVVSGTVGYLADLFLALGERGIEWGYRNLALSDIALSRNIFASHVIADNAFSHVLFIDADMGFQSASILGLLDYAKPVTALACPKRFVSWDRIRRIVAAEEARPEDKRRPTSALMDIALDYNVATTRFDGSPWQARRDGKFLSVPAVGTGVMLVHRDVFEIMLARDVARPRLGHQGLPLLDGAPYCDFFSPLEVPDGSMIESEDISFCQRWVEGCDGEIWVDIDSRVMHYGMRGHSGRYLPRSLSDFPE